MFKQGGQTHTMVVDPAPLKDISTDMEEPSNYLK